MCRTNAKYFIPCPERLIFVETCDLICSFRRHLDCILLFLLEVYSTCGLPCEQVYHAAAVRLVDKVIAGDDGLLLLAGTPGSGRSHTLWGHSPNAPGLFPRSLAALARGCRGGNGTPFYPLPPSASTFVVRVCAAEVHGGDVRDLLPAANSISSGDDARRREHSRSSPGRTGRWTLSSRGLLSSLPSSSGSNRGGEGDGGRSPQRRVRRGVGRRFYADDPSALTPKALVTSRVLVGVSEVTVGGVDEALQFVRHVSASVHTTILDRNFCTLAGLLSNVVFSQVSDNATNFP